MRNLFFCHSDIKLGSGIANDHLDSASSNINCRACHCNFFFHCRGFFSELVFFFFWQAYQVPRAVLSERPYFGPLGRPCGNRIAKEYLFIVLYRKNFYYYYYYISTDLSYPCFLLLLLFT